MICACLYNVLPASVGVTPRLVLTNSCWRHSPSSVASCWLNAGCAICRISAAWVRLPISTILTKYFRRRRFTIDLLAVQPDSDARITPLTNACRPSVLTCCSLEFFMRSNDNAIAPEVFCMTPDVAGSTQLARQKLFIPNTLNVFISNLLLPHRNKLQALWGLALRNFRRNCMQA